MTQIDATDEGDVVAFDLDEDGAIDAVAADADHDGVADVAAFDLDESDATDEGSWMADEGAVITDDDEADGSMAIPLHGPSDDVTNEDMDQAASDMRHIEAMNQYMWDRGVIDAP